MQLVAPTLVLALLGSGQSVASEIYRAEATDGTLSFTDSPTQAGTVGAPEGGGAGLGIYELFVVDGPPPTTSKVSLRNFPLLDTWDESILGAAERYGVPSALIKAVCLAESGMNPNARSGAGAMGLMQLMPDTATGLGVDDPWDPSASIDGGTRYLAKMIETFGSYRLALAAYNAGPANVTRHGGVPPFQQTRIYVGKVLDLYELFNEERPVGSTGGLSPFHTRGPGDGVVP